MSADDEKMLVHVGHIAREALEKVRECFVDGVKITLLVRNPKNDDADFILTDDELEKVIEAFEREHTETEL